MHGERGKPCDGGGDNECRISGVGVCVFACVCVRACVRVCVQQAGARGPH